MSILDGNVVKEGKSGNSIIEFLSDGLMLHLSINVDLVLICTCF